MRLGLYGMPAAGKTYIIEKIDFLKTFTGSLMLRELCPDFYASDEKRKNEIRRQLADSLKKKDNFIMDGHYAFGDTVAFTDNDGSLYDVFMYLYISPQLLEERMQASERNRKYLKYDLEEWQIREIECLRSYCHKHNKDFYVIDNPPENKFDDVKIVLDFIRAVIDGYSCSNYALQCADDIIKKSTSDTIILMDGDKTLTLEDTSSAVFGYKTHLYDGNFYTGYQSWKQDKEFESYSFSDLTSIPVELNNKVLNQVSTDTFILTSGHERIWRYISNELGIPFYYGSEMSAETKFYITKKLQEAGKKVIAYGDGMNDYYMLRQADEGYLVTKKDTTISRSLKGKSLEGLHLV